jgi:branched-chain amino acid transport system ATP-binding protein
MSTIGDARIRHAGAAPAKVPDTGMPNVPTILEVAGVSKRFGSLVAVSDVSLKVRKGELRAIIGPNGAGKTTFFNLISGLFAPSTGRIVFDGRDITTLAAHRRVTLGMARTFQITEIFPELTVFENVRIGTEVAMGYALRPWVSRAERDEVRRRVVDALHLVGLTPKADRLVGELAPGDQRSVEIAMALSLQPQLLLLDEPTAGMGDQETYAITQLIRRLHRTGNITIVLIEHDMRVVFHLADMITVLDRGALLAEGTPQEIAANEGVQAAYLGKSA